MDSVKAGTKCNNWFCKIWNICLWLQDVVVL